MRFRDILHRVSISVQPSRWLNSAARARIVPATSLLIVLNAACAAVGTTVVRRTFDDVCARAEFIFSGKVTTVESRRDGETGAIHTFVTFDSLEWVHGAGGETFTLRILGGEVDGEKLEVGGMPRFTVGERYVAFVRGNGRVVCPLVGWRQGCFHESAGGQSQPQRVVKTFDGREVLAVANGRLVTGSVDSTTRSARVSPMTVDAFLAAVRERVATDDATNGVTQP